MKAFRIKRRQSEPRIETLPLPGPPIARAMLRRIIFAGNCGANQSDELVAQAQRRALN